MKIIYESPVEVLGLLFRNSSLKRERRTSNLPSILRRSKLMRNLVSLTLAVAYLSLILFLALSSKLSRFLVTRRVKRVYLPD